MCWVCQAKNLREHEAAYDFEVYKLVLEATSNKCTSLYQKFVYEAGVAPNSVNLKVVEDVEDVEEWFKIYEGYHSYSSVQFVLNSTRTTFSLTGKIKSIKLGNLLNVLPIMNNLHLAEFIIPKGSIYFINSSGVIVSNKIMYTGKYMKL